MKKLSLALAATLAAISLASAQTYLDSGGTVVRGVAPLVGCSGSGKCAGPVSSANPLPVADISHNTHASAECAVTVTATAASLAALVAADANCSAGVPSWATMAYITPETGAIRCRVNAAPTNAAGSQPIAMGQSWPISGPSLASIQCIAPAPYAATVEFRG